MALFGPPDVEKLKAKNNVKKLIKLTYSFKDRRIRQQAFMALGELATPEAIDALRMHSTINSDPEGKRWANKALYSDSARKAMREGPSVEMQKEKLEELKISTREKLEDSKTVKTLGREQAIEWWNITGRSTAHCNSCNKAMTANEGYIVEAGSSTAANEVVAAVAGVPPPDLICENCFQTALNVKPYPNSRFNHYKKFLT